MRASRAKVQRVMGGSVASKAGMPNAQISIAHGALSLRENLRCMSPCAEYGWRSRRGSMLGIVLTIVMGVSTLRSRTSRDSGNLTLQQ